MANPRGNPQNLKAPFQPGQSGNPGGSTKGYRKTLQGDFLRSLAKDFSKHGAEAIRQAREDDPLGYVRTIAALMPKEVELVRPLEALSDDELSAIAEQLRSALGTGSVREGDRAPRLPSEVN
jgi:hypothetical protein